MGELHKLITGISGGDITAAKELYELMRIPVYYYCLSILKNVDEAEDVMQETFIRIIKYAYSYKKNDNPKVWIFKIARNLTLDVIKKKLNFIDYNQYEYIRSDNSFEENYVNSNFILQLLSELNQDEQEIVKLRLFGELSHIQIAKVLSMPYEKVR